MEASMATASRPPDLARTPRSWHATLGGLLLMLAGGAILMGIITAESLYPAPYSTHRNTVSDLAAMRPQNLVRQPSAAIFNWTMIVTGLLVLIAAYCLYRALQRWSVAIPAGLLGVGILGVGVFSGVHMTEHQWFAALAFAAGSIAAILSWKVLQGPLRYLAVVLGAVALASMVVGDFFMGWTPAARLGEGGVERWIAYPVVLWMVAFGAWLTNHPAAEQTSRAPVRNRSRAGIHRGARPLSMRR
jgi:hypothetical membrane protein